MLIAREICWEDSRQLAVSIEPGTIYVPEYGLKFSRERREIGETKITKESEVCSLIPRYQKTGRERFGNEYDTIQWLDQEERRNGRYVTRANNSIPYTPALKEIDLPDDLVKRAFDLRRENTELQERQERVQRDLTTIVSEVLKVQ